MSRERRRIIAVAASLTLASFMLAGCAGPFNIMQRTIYHDDDRIAQGFDTYTVVNRTGSAFDKIHVGEFTGLKTWLRLSAPEGGGTCRIDYETIVSAGDFKIVFVEDGASVDLICEGTESGSRTFSLEQGDYALKAVGAHARADISIELHATEGITAIEPGDGLDEDRPFELQPLED